MEINVVLVEEDIVRAKVKMSMMTYHVRLVWCLYAARPYRRSQTPLRCGLMVYVDVVLLTMAVLIPSGVDSGHDRYAAVYTPWVRCTVARTSLVMITLCRLPRSDGLSGLPVCVAKLGALDEVFVSPGLIVDVGDESMRLLI